MLSHFQPSVPMLILKKKKKKNLKQANTHTNKQTKIPQPLHEAQSCHIFFYLF